MAKYEYWLTPEGLLRVEGWARDGLINKQIAHNIGISEQTLNEWRKKYPEFSESLKKGKDVVDREVENALLRRALGYDYTEERIEKSAKDGTKIVQTLKHVPPDVGACAFWLKNRKPEQWRERREAAPGQDGAQAGVLMMPEVMRPDE